MVLTEAEKYFLQHGTSLKGDPITPKRRSELQSKIRSKLLLSLMDVQRALDSIYYPRKTSLIQEVTNAFKIAEIVKTHYSPKQDDDDELNTLMDINVQSPVISDEKTETDSEEFEIL